MARSPVGLGAIRLAPEPEDPDRPSFEDSDIDLSEPEIDKDKATTIMTPDGGAIVRIGPPKLAKKDSKFEDNLAEVLSDSELGAIADDLLRLIDLDNTSRAEWLATRERGIEIMGLKIEAMRTSGADGSAPIDGMSNARATLLCEAVVRFAANAFAELFPSDGPAKVAEVTASADQDLDDLADALEVDLNDYLLNVDKPYIPDSDAMLPRVGVDGSVFKKVYHDPILRRPISRSIYGEDLIINNSATSIYDAKRITHRVMMEKSTVKRMQLIGAYRDVELGDPGQATKSPPEMATEEISGIRKNEMTIERDDGPHEFYECYCELDLPGFEHQTKGEDDGLAIPYKVVIHKESQEVVEIRRNYDEDDDMCLPKTWFVQYCFIRGFGVYGIGLSHLLGNITNGLTAAWREFIDAGMFNNFPGGVVAKQSMRQNTNLMRAGPGEFVPMETGGNDIRQSIMPFPYKGLDAVFVQFMQQLEQTGQRLGGTAEVMVGEGRQDAPVGTTLALIEQAIKPLLATHKRLCGSLSDELQLLVERFREDPESFFRGRKKTALNGDVEKFLQAIENRSLIPRADPNTASHLQRMMRNAALYQMAKDDPPAFNLTEIRTDCIRGIGFGNPARYLNANPQGPPPDPKAIAAQMGAQADLLDAQTKAQQISFDQQNRGIEDQNRDQDRVAKLKIAGVQLQREQLIQQGEVARADNSSRTDMVKASLDHQADAAEQQRDHIHDALMQRDAQAHEHHLAGAEQAHDMRQAAFEAANQPPPATPAKSKPKGKK